MLDIIWNTTLLVCAIVFIAFTFVVAYGAPYLPTLRAKVPLALKMLNLKKGQTLLELGSGDGRLLRAAAGRGLNAVGYELNPLLVIYSKLITFKYRKQVQIIWGNYWKAEWPKTDGIFVFLLQPYMEKLDKKITQSKLKNISLVSFAFIINSKKPVKQIEGLYLYKY